MREKKFRVSRFLGPTKCVRVVVFLSVEFLGCVVRLAVYPNKIGLESKNMRHGFATSTLLERPAGAAGF